MKKYEIAAYTEEGKKTRIIEVENEGEAEEIGWYMFDTGMIYVSEVEEE